MPGHRVPSAILAATLLGASPAPAQSLDAITRHLAEMHRGCDIYNPRVSYHGALAGAPAPVVIVAYTYEGCVGNDWATAFGVFFEEDGRLASYRIASAPPWVVERIRVRRGVIEVTGLDYAPGDPRCCPTQRRSARYVLRGDTIIPAR